MERKHTVAIAITAALLVAVPALAGWPGDPAKCKDDAVKTGPVCMDKYEASVWEVPNATTTNKGLVNKIRNGKVKLSDLTAGGAVQRGVSSDDYPVSCPDNGQGCAEIYAASVVGVKPSTRITWFQAQQACFNSRKRLPSNGEWQGAVSGTPDPGPDNGTTDCNTTAAADVNTGSRSACVSRFGAFDMVGNAAEMVADWVPRSTLCGTWNSSGDNQCLLGADTTGDPGVLVRGGSAIDDTFAGPLSVIGLTSPADSALGIGFRCAR